MSPSWAGAGVAMVVAVGAGLADRRRRRRRDADRVGWVDWPVVQLLALLGVVIAVSLALNG